MCLNENIGCTVRARNAAITKAMKHANQTPKSVHDVTDTGLSGE